MAEFDDPSPSDSQLIGSARRVGLAVDSCALLSPNFTTGHRVAVAQMRVNIGGDSFPDHPELDYRKLYRRLSGNADLAAWTSAPKPDEWLETITEASHGVEAVVCLTVAAGLSASYDSARVAAQLAVERNPHVEVHVIDSGTISGALNLLSMEVLQAVELGHDVEGVENVVQVTKPGLRTAAVLDSLDRMHRIARIPQLALQIANGLNIKPVVTHKPEGFRLVATPLTSGVANRKMLRTISEDIGEGQAKFAVLHVDAPEKAHRVATEIRKRFDCQFMNICDFHPFIGLYAGRGAIGVAWLKL